MFMLLDITAIHYGCVASFSEMHDCRDLAISPTNTVANLNSREAIMRRICAWCKKDLDDTYSDLHETAAVTHGICDACSIRILMEHDNKLSDFLDSLFVPVAVVNETGKIKMANRQARDLLKKNLPEIEGQPSGDVFECVNSGLPGGCGNTIHCSGCAIRNAVMDTFQSGKSQVTTPAYFNRRDPDDVHKIGMLISTEKVGPLVMLRVDRIEEVAEEKSSDI
jgi:PAS domain-containing protein